MAKNIAIVEKVLTDDMVIPDFPEFSQEIINIYDNVKENDGERDRLTIGLIEE